MELPVLFAASPVMPPTSFTGASVRNLLSAARPLRRLSTQRLPVTAIAQRTPDPNAKKKRGRRKELEQWQKMIDRDLNADNRGQGFWPSGASPRLAAEKRAYAARIDRRNEKLLRYAKAGGIVDTTLRGGALDMLLHTLRARYLERMHREDVEERATPLTDDVEALYALAVKEIRRCDALYYADDPQPLVSDQEYDELVMHLLELERVYPQIVAPDSPSQTVGHAAARDAAALGDASEADGEPVRAAEMGWRTPARNFKQVTHPVRMLSLANAYSQADLKSFAAKVEHSGSRVAVEMKIDGVALSLHYEARRLVVAVTRGNGRVGDDVTENVRAALVGRGVPEELPMGAPDGLVVVRGEVFISPDDFRRLQEASETKLSNARNSAAGALKHKDPAEVRARCPQFVAYECLVRPVAADGSAAGDGAGEFESAWSTQGETLAGLPGWGFGAMPKYAVLDTVSEVEQFAAEMEAARSTLPFEADGVVLKLDDASRRTALGSTAKAPRGAIALKFTARSVVTTVNAVRMQVSRTGVVTPVAELSPVVLGGATISRATLHNFDEVERIGVAVGDDVMLERGGDVIPKITHVEKLGQRRVPIVPPAECPCCGSDLIVDKPEGGSTSVTCTEPTECAGKNLGRLLHFARRDAMDIAGVGTKTASKLLDAGLVVRLADIFKLTLEDIMGMDGFKEKSSRSLHEAIQRAGGGRSLERLIIALGVPGIGRASARALAVNAVTIEGLQKLTRGSDAALLNMPNVAEKSAERIAEYLGSIRMQAELAELAKAVQLNGVVDEADADEAGDGEKKVVDGIEISGKLFAVTGTLNAMPRAQALKQIKAAGGRVSATVSNKTDFLICGVDPGFKYHKAQRLGVRVLFEEDLKTLLGSAETEAKKSGMAKEAVVAQPKLLKNPEIERILKEHGDAADEPSLTDGGVSDEQLDAAVSSMSKSVSKSSRRKKEEQSVIEEEMTLEEGIWKDLRDPASTFSKGFGKPQPKITSKSKKIKKQNGGMSKKQLEKEIRAFDRKFEGDACIPSEEEIDKELAVLMKDPEILAHLADLERRFPVDDKS